MKTNSHEKKYAPPISIFIFGILTGMNAILLYLELISVNIALVGLATTLFVAATLKISDLCQIPR